MKKISFLLCLSMTFNNLAIEQASAKETNSYETCFVYENMDENKVSLEEIARELFADPLCTTLNKKVGKRKIKSCKSEELRNLATALYNKQYDTQFRVNSFKPVYSPEALGKLLHIGDGYSTYQHITGIVLKPGKHIIVVDGLKEGSKLGVKVADLYAPNQGDEDWSLHFERFELKNGINVIEKTSEWTGLAYMDYYFDNPEKENTVKVHFITGEVNGYFDASVNTNEDWDRMLANAVYPVFDATGSNIHLAYPVEDLKKYAPGQGKELIDVYEQLVSKQHEIIGWKNTITSQTIKSLPASTTDITCSATVMA